MDLRDLVKLAGIVNPEVLNKLEPTVEADGAGFEDATTRPQEEMMDDPMATMGSDADLSLRRYLKAKGDHVTVDEEVYPDHTVESVTEAYAAFKAESATPNLDKEIAAYFKQIRTPAKGFGGKLKAEASIGAPDYNLAIGDYESNVEDANPHTHDYGMFTKKGNEEVGMRVEDAAVLLMDGDYESKEQALKIMLQSLDNLAEDPEFEEATDTDVRERAIAMFEKMLEVGESVEIDEPEVGEGNAYSGALAKAKAAGADEFEVDGKVHKVKEGAVKDAMIDDAEKMSKAAFIKKYGEENAGTWESVNESLDEGAKPDYIDIDGDGDKEESMKKSCKRQRRRRRC